MERTFNILKDGFIASNNNKFWDIFNLDSFNFTAGMQATLTVEQIYVLVDKFEYVENVPQIEIINDITNYIFKSFGGNSNTPVNEVLAFGYLLFASPNLRMDDMFKSVLQGIHFHTTLRFLFDNDRIVPAQYVNGVRHLIDDKAVFNIVFQRYPVEIVSNLDSDEYQVWLDATLGDIGEYIKGVNATRNAFKDI
jgi:hypothetical protein